MNPNGVMEIMVYNHYHRAVTSAFQKAARIFGENRGTVDFEADLAVAKKIAKEAPIKESLARGFIQYIEISESDLADLLIQPVERSYNVGSLERRAESCGLELWTFCISQYAKYYAMTSWNMEFKDVKLLVFFDALPDSRRWQITNLTLHERSPMLWVYLRRKESDIPRKFEMRICEEFLETEFELASATQRSYIRERDGKYRFSPRSIRYTLVPPDASVRNIFELVSAGDSLGEAFRRLKIAPMFQKVNHLRLHLATTALPSLRARHAG